MAQLVAQLLGLPPVAETGLQLLLATGALGLFGPLISGTGAAGTGIQDVLDSLGSGDLATIINAIIGAQGTFADGLVNGEFGPNLGPLLGFPALFTVLARGIINPGDLIPPPLDLTVPGAVPTLQTLVTLLSGLLTPPDMASVNSVTANVALAAPAPIPDADLEDVLGAVQTAAEILLDDLGDLPDDVAQFVQNVAEFPQSLPLEVVKLVNGRIDAVQLAGRTVGLTVIGTLPENLRAPAAALPLAIEGVVDDVQDAVEDAATPTPQPLQATQAGGGPQLQRLSGTDLDDKDQVGDPGVPRRSLAVRWSTSSSTTRSIRAAAAPRLTDSKLRTMTTPPLTPEPRASGPSAIW